MMGIGGVRMARLLRFGQHGGNHDARLCGFIWYGDVGVYARTRITTSRCRGG